MTGSAPARRKIVIVSGVHDYRTPRRGSIQQLADALVRLGDEVTFISLRFSPVSRAKGDHRLFLWDRANRAEDVNGVTCYLWRTAFHPFRSGIAALDAAARLMFSTYAALPNRFIDDEFRAASHIVIESGLGIMLIHRARRLNPRARIIYRGSDALHTIGAPPALAAELRRRVDEVDAFCLLAERIADDLAWAAGKTFVVPQGVNSDEFAAIGPSPYAGGVNAVTAGSMLFDASFFQHAAARRPDIQFHLIGTGASFAAPANVRFYKEMPFRATLPYIKHADFGIAAYKPQANSGYLAQSSLKLMQFEYLGLPAVCADFATGESPNRFGYAPGDGDGIARAIGRALARGRFAGAARFLSWEEIARRLLDPEAYADTAIRAAQ
ncbi:MAG: GumK N-terminal domain-containing glycosyltransferase, partial [Pseudolabrys sp.]